MKTRPQNPADLVYDPYDKDIDTDPHKIWRRLRDEAPLYYNERYDFYALSRFDDVYGALENWRDYSSAKGTVLELMNTGDSAAGAYGLANLGMIIFTDPPAHDISRRLVQKLFLPKAVSVFESRARRLCQQLFEGVEGESEFDLVERIIRPVPPMMIGEILGVPEEDQAYLGRLVDESLTFDPDEGPDEIKDGVRKGKKSHMEIAEYIGRHVANRMKSPKDDLITKLIESEVKLDDGASRKLDIRELVSFAMLLLSAGSETTARALSWAGVLLARYPEQRRTLVEDPGKIRNAVEEVLRYEAPSPIQARYVTRDVEWYGVTIPCGSKLALLNGAAGRDERKFDHADQFNVQRTISRHLSFGFGTHICLGASLARLEMYVVLDELLKRYPEWHVDESRVKMVHTTTVRGPAFVPIQVG